jgi:hypothetical protein
VEGVVRAAVEGPGEARELRRPTRLEHAHDRRVLLAHADEDPGHGIGAAEAALDVARELGELALLARRIEAEGARRVPVGVDPRLRAAAVGEEGGLHPRVPLDRVEDADRALRVDEPVRELADRAFEGVGGGGRGHRAAVPRAL